MPEWMTPLFRELVAIPSFGFCSTRKTSCQRAETARAMAQPTTPPPMIRIFAWSINPFYPEPLSVDIDFIEERFAFDKPRFRPVVHRVNGVLLFFIMISPERRRAVRAILIQGIEENVKRRELFLVVVVIVRDACQRLQACFLRRFPAPHHFHDGVPARNFDILFAFARRARRPHFVIHEAARPDNWRIAHAPWYFPCQPCCGRRRGDVPFLIQDR